MSTTTTTSILLLLLLTIHTDSLLILDKLAQIKDKLVSKVLGGGQDNCGCPCREYNVVKCDLEWVEHCYQEHYHTKCEQRQAYKPRMVSLKLSPAWKTLFQLGSDS